ncbi:MAG: S41 family peptidase, partial [Planctomycetota bacterium]
MEQTRNRKGKLVAGTLKILGLVLIFWASNCANANAGTDVADCCVAASTAAQAESEADTGRPSEGKFHRPECFDRVWNIINDEFWDPNFNGVDWEDARERYRSKALAAEDHESFAAVVNQMLGELKTSHTRYFTKWEPEYYTLQAVFTSATLADVSAGETSVLVKYLSKLRSSQGEPHRSGIGVVTKDMGGRHYVTAVLSSSPAEKAGILLGDWLVEVNGQPFHPIRSFENKVGQEAELTIQRSPQASSRSMLRIIPVDSVERELFESDSHARPRFIEHGGHRFGYVRLWWLNGLAMRQVLEYGLNAGNMSEGIIIDIRDGFGGTPGYEYIAPFLKYG